MAFVLPLAFGVLFTYLSLLDIRRHYNYKKHGTLLTGEVVDYQRTYSSTRSVVFFTHEKTPLRLPVLQGFWFTYPKKGKKVPIYYTPEYKDYVFLANRPQTVWDAVLLLFGLGFFVFALLGFLGFIPTK